MKNLLCTCIPMALAMPASLHAQTISQELVLAQQQNEGFELALESVTGGMIVGLVLALIYIGIWIGSIISVAKHPFKSWMPKLIWLICILVFELPASFAWFLFRPRISKAAQIPPLATEPLAAKAPMPKKVVMPK